MRKDKDYVTIRVRIKPPNGKAYWDKWTLPKPMKLTQAQRWAEKQMKEWNEMMEFDPPEKIVRFG